MYKITHANIKEWAANYDGPLFDGILCDPPYELGFMGKSWDSSGIAFDTEMWADLFKLIKPGGHLLAFSGSRTYHRMAVAIEDAGFEIRDQIIWLYGQGFPKALNINKQLKTCECGGNAVPYIHDSELRQLPERDEKEPIPIKEEQGQVLQPSVSEQGTHRTMQGQEPSKGLETGEESSLEGRQLYRATEGLQDDTDARTPQSETERLCVGTPAGSGTDAWQTARGDRGSTPHQRGQGRQQTGEPEGLPRPQQPLDGESLPRCSKCQRPILQGEYKTSLKPSHEPAVLARKPLDKGMTVANNVLKHGTGGLNIDGTRIPTQEHLGRPQAQNSESNPFSKGLKSNGYNDNSQGKRFPANLIHDGSDEVEAVFPQTKNGGGNSTSKRETWLRQETEPTKYAGDSGSASRFFYCAKSSKSERNAGLEGFEEVVKPFRVDNGVNTLGRFPSNFIHDGSDEVEAVFPQSKDGTAGKRNAQNGDVMKTGLGATDTKWGGYGSGGSASRFFYTAKSSRAERNAGLDSTRTIKYNTGICKDDNIELVQLLRRATSELTMRWLTDESGVNIMAQCQSDSLSTILTTINKITTSQILSLWMHSHTNESTQAANSEMASGGSLARSAESSSSSAKTNGISQKRGGLSTEDVSRVISELLSLIKDEENWQPSSNIHSTVKPLSLTKYLATLIKPPTGGRLLVPFSGSGSEMIGALQAGWEYVEGVELTEEYIPIAEARIAHWIKIPVQETLGV